MPTMSPVDVQGTLKEICFAPGIHWDAESLGQVFGCGAARIGSIPGVIRQCALSAAGVRLYEFEYAFLSTVQVARMIGKSRTAVVRLKRKGRLNPRCGPNDSAMFLVREVNELVGSSAVTADRCARIFSISKDTNDGGLGEAGRFAVAVADPQRLRALLQEDIRLFEQLQGVEMPTAARDRWQEFIEERRHAVRFGDHCGRTGSSVSADTVCH